MIIRNETSSDINAISKVTIAAFRDLAISNHNEKAPKGIVVFLRRIPGK